MPGDQTQSIVLCPIVVTPDDTPEETRKEIEARVYAATKAESGMPDCTTHELPEQYKDSTVHPIDLPGEPVLLQGSVDHTVLLRKHRDIILDFDLGDGTQYLVQSPNDHFYHEKTQKRVKSARFNDGERFHARVGRNFKGPLKIISKHGTQALDPNQLDDWDYGDNPKAKPDPIVIKAGVQPQSAAAATSATSDTPPPYTRVGYMVEVQDIDSAEVPQPVKDAKQSNEAHAPLDTDDASVWEWALGEIAGAVGYVGDNRGWLKELGRESFYLTSKILKDGTLRYYIVFTGKHTDRSIIAGTKYKTGTAQVINISKGAGPVRNLAKMAGEDIKAFGTKGGLFGLFVVGAIDIVHWAYKDNANLGNLFGVLGMDIGEVAVSIVLADVGIGLVMGGLSLFNVTVGSPVLLFIAGGLIVGAAINWGITKLDEHFHWTETVESWAHEIWGYLEETFANDYDHLTSGYKNIPKVTR